VKKEMARFSTSGVIDLMIVGFLAAILLPIAINEIIGVNTGSWSTTSQTLWTNLPIMLLLVVILGVIAKVKG
jgi:hypothetical protein